VNVYNARDLLYLLPLGVIGLIRWACWLVIRIPAAYYRPVVNNHRQSLTVVVPVYREDPKLFAYAIESWLRNDVDEVILVIDDSDTACIEVASRYPVRVITTDVPGKRDAMRRGWETATTTLVALVDSDTIWANDVAQHVCMPFLDRSVGGVSTRQSVYRNDSFLQRINDMYLDYRYFDENAAQTVVGRALSCVSGRTAVYRRKLLLEVSDEFMSETFMGVPCKPGDDKCLTRLVLARGYHTVMQRSARVWSTFPSTFAAFVRQRLRWSRNTWRSDIKALLSERWAWRYPFLTFTMINKAVGTFTILIAPVVMAMAIAHQNWGFVGALSAWWLVSRSLKMLPHLRRHPEDLALIPPFIFLSFFMATVKIGALLTIRQQRWLTRPPEAETVVHDHPAATPGVA
jgi:cellulose synthase/poly-beta-1,6-N-acetylglucosamine synthase-like glycosyltransferase